MNEESDDLVDVLLEYLECDVFGLGVTRDYTVVCPCPRPSVADSTPMASMKEGLV